MKEKFKDIQFRDKNSLLLDNCLNIVTEYEKSNIKVTLRQLYYQLVSRNLMKNCIKEYGRLSRVITDARYGGLVDWDIIEDNTRIPYIPSVFDSLPDLVKNAISSYSLDRWKTQEYYIELFVEKDALTSLLKPITSKWNCYLNVNRGYSSTTSMYNASKRYLNHTDKQRILYYIGDFDPSGLDMLRDIQSRLNDFKCEGVKIIPIALTQDQIQQYKLPPNPAKMTDTRSKAFIEKYGKESYEADALPPDVLTKQVESCITSLIDMDKWNSVVSEESVDMKKLEEVLSQLQK